MVLLLVVAAIRPWRSSRRSVTGVADYDYDDDHDDAAYRGVGGEPLVVVEVQVPYHTYAAQPR